MAYAGNDIHFIVMGEEQEINANQDWTTTISGHLILLGNVSSEEYKKSKHFKSWQSPDLNISQNAYFAVKTQGQLSVAGPAQGTALGSLLAGTANGGYENNNRTTSPPSSSSGQRRNTKKSNTPVLLQPYDRERTTVTKTDLEDLASHKDVVDRLAGNIKSMREDLTRMCLAYGLPPVTTATSDPSQQPSQHQHQHTGGIFGQHQGQDQQRQNPALAAHQYGAAPTRSNAFF